MSTATAPARHRAHHTRVVGVVAVLASTACRDAVPRPPVAPLATSDYVAVPFPPRPPPPEYVPPRPHRDAVWIDGSWEWRSRRYLWRYGTWLVVPKGLRYARWAMVRRAADGQLFFAPAGFRDANGKKVDDRTFRTALGRSARARSRPGGDAVDPDGNEAQASEYAPADLQDSDLPEAEP